MPQMRSFAASQAVVKSASVKRNAISNLASRLYAAGLSFFVLPLYLRLLTPEGYGLVGVFVTLQNVVMLLDLGLSPLMTRELARLSALPDTQQEQRDLVRTLEIVYWLLGACIGIGIVILAPVIARYGFHAQKLPQATVISAVRIIGLVMLFQWPDSFYSSGLQGLQRQVTLNIIRVFTATLQSAGALFVLYFVSRTVGAYFGWMAVVWAVQTALLIGCLWKFLPHNPLPARFRRELWQKNARFTRGMTGVALATVLLSQSDKLVVSASLSLTALGYYTLATNLSNLLPLLFAPLYNAVFPRFSQLVALEDEAALSKFYHKSCQMMAVLVLPIAIGGVLFAHELLSLYLRSPETVHQVEPVFRLLLIGVAFNGLVTLPYALQLAYGWTSLAAKKNLLALVVVVPLTWLAVRQWGAIGGCVMCLTTNIGYFLLEIPIMHRRLLRGEMGAWYAQDVFQPLGISLAVVGAARLLFPSHASALVTLACIALTTLAAIACALLSMSWGRGLLKRLRP